MSVKGSTQRKQKSLITNSKKVHENSKMLKINTSGLAKRQKENQTIN